VQSTSSTFTQGLRSESKSFAVSKTVHHTIEPSGQIKRVAAAVLVDDFIEVKDVNGKPQETRRKRTPEEMKQFEDLVRATLGFNMQRGDELSLQNVSFQEPPVEAPLTLTPVQRTLRVISPWIGLLRYVGLAALFLVVYLLILRPVTRQVVTTLKELPAHVGETAIPGAAGGKAQNKTLNAAEMQSELEQELSGTNSEVNRAIVLKRHLVDKVKKEPEGASRLIQNWVRQDS
jgi:flagellar M-ring protein FliF